MKKVVIVECWECVCERPGCPREGRPWISLVGHPPSICPTCRSREWDGKKIKHQPSGPKISLPKPTRVIERGTSWGEF